jgi:sugar/nucleoside kinase (ribokinase family)
MFLKDLLASNHPLFTISLRQLEQATGNAGIDTRLIADITHTAHQVMRELALDVSDVTGEELYHSLLNAVPSGRVETLLDESDFVLVNLGDGPISLNMLDVIENSHHELPYEKRQVAHGQRHLRAEIIRRYAEHDKTDGKLIQRLVDEMGLKHGNDDHLPLLSTLRQPDDAPSILAIGDIFTDAFIQLCEDRARIDTDPDGSKRLSMEFGSKPPYERADIIQAVGPSPNAAVAFSRLGVKASLMAYLGNDQPGEDSLQYLKSEQIDTSLVSVQNDIKSNYYYVLRYGADRTILVKNEDYDYSWQMPSTVPDWVYLSLISKSAWQLHEDLITYLDDNPSVKLAFQPGTFHFDWGVEKLKRIYARSYIVVMNREEAALVSGQSKDSIAELAKALHDLGPEIVIITDGPDGSYASYDSKLLKMPNYPDPAPPFDRTGAGDAFASTIVAALAQGEPIETALRWAPINSMSVVQKLGAQEGLLTRAKIEEYLKSAPDSYSLEEMK